MKNAPCCGRLVAMLLLVATVSVTLVSTVPSGASADAVNGTWSKLFEGAPVPAPPPAPPLVTPVTVAPGRTSFGLVYDSLRDRMIAYSGDPDPMNNVWAIGMAPGSQWERILPDGSVPPTRYGVSMIYDAAADRIVIYGGYHGGPNRLGDVWQLTLSGTPTWTELFPAGAPPEPRQDAAAIYDAVGNRMVLFGGYTQSNNFVNQVWTLSLTGSPTWTAMTPSGAPPSGRNTPGYALDTSRRHLIVSGGYNFGGFQSDTWRLDLNGAGTWSQIVTGSSPPARRHSYSVYDAARDRFVIFGGEAISLFDDSWELTLGGSPAWTQVSPAGPPPTKRGGGEAIYDAARQRMVIFGGVTSIYPRTVWARSLDATPTWTLFHSGLAVPEFDGSATLPAEDGVALPRTSFGMALDATRDRMVVFGGDPGPKNDAYAMSLAAPATWSYLTSATSAPRHRYGPGAIVDPVGDRLIVFGGFDLGGRLDDTWALSLAPSGSWTKLTTGGAPILGRQDPATIYDPVGQRMVVFGGYTQDGDFTNQVWTLSLNGATDWTYVPTTGTPPSGRNTVMYAHDSARNRLIVFGGYDGSAFCSDTWSLDLATMAWSQVLTGATPPARRQGFAVYDVVRDKFVLFGGYDGSQYSDVWELSLTGAPAWTQLAPAGGGPSARGGGHAVYDATRQRMVVYGGYDGTYPRDAWALSLDATPTWTLVHSGQGLIERRRDMAMVHRPAGNELLQFGGAGYRATFPLYNQFDDVWRLDLDIPSATWERMSVAGARPSARHGHRGVWDPIRQRMLVFGGYDFNYKNDVWAFDPASSAWTELFTSGLPPSTRMYGGVTYDPVRDRLLVIGGHPPYLIDIWELPLSGASALTWSPISPSGAPPSGRWIYGMQYDPNGDRMVFFGGVTAVNRPNETWALSLSGTPTWTLLTPAGAPPTGRSDHAMIYEPVGRRMVVFGGASDALQFFNDAWALSMTGPLQWTQLNPTGGPPGQRDIIQAVYDPNQGRMIVHGGWSGSQFLNDTWALTWGTPPVAVQASLIDFQAEPSLVRLNWSLRSTSSARATVERRAGTGGWSALGTPEATGSERVTYEDRSVSPGSRYHYRLRIVEDGATTHTDEVLVDVPNRFQLELAGPTPNPTSGDRLAIGFTLATRSKSRLDLIDVAGRQIESRNLEAFEPGRHQVRFGESRRLEPGVYIIRLAAEGRVLTAKAMVVR